MALFAYTTGVIFWIYPSFPLLYPALIAQKIASEAKTSSPGFIHINSTAIEHKQGHLEAP